MACATRNISNSKSSHPACPNCKILPKTYPNLPTKNPEDPIKESYLIWSKAVLAAVHGVEGLDPATARKVDFYTRQFVDALSPSNFLATNPEVLAATLETGGQNLLRGLENLLEDLQRGKGRLSITMTDMEAFRLGENIAATPGKVVFQNDLMQLIQYTPTTPDVRRRPLLIVPPWINKFYVLDLQPKNSFIKWAVDQGHTVFVISWVNPDEKLAEKSFEDYMGEGPLAALDAVEMAIQSTPPAIAWAALCSRRPSPIWRRAATSGSPAPHISSRSSTSRMPATWRCSSTKSSSLRSMSA